MRQNLAFVFGGVTNGIEAGVKAVKTNAAKILYSNNSGGVA